MKENKLVTWCNNHPKTIFITRFILWTTFAAVLPFVFIAWRYDIFTSESKIKLTGWGLIAIIIVIVFLSTLIKYIYKGLQPGIAKQCISGVIKTIIPLLLLYFLVLSVESNIHLFKQALGCVILCEAAAIPLNPFPEWLANRDVEMGKQKATTMSDIFWDRFFKGKDE